MDKLKWLFTMQRNDKGKVQPPPIIWIAIFAANIASLVKTWKEIKAMDRAIEYPVNVEDTITRWKAANTVRCQFCDQAHRAGDEMCVFHTAKMDHDLPEYSYESTRTRNNNWREGIIWLREQLDDKDSAFIDILTTETHPRGIRINVTHGISDAKDD